MNAREGCRVRLFDETSFNSTRLTAAKGGSGQRRSAILRLQTCPIQRTHLVLTPGTLSPGNTCS